MNPFNPSQSRSVAISFQVIPSRLADLEATLDRAGAGPPFSHCVSGLSPTGGARLRDYFACTRAALFGLLRDCDTPRDAAMRILLVGDDPKSEAYSTKGLTEGQFGVDASPQDRPPDVPAGGRQFRVGRGRAAPTR